MLQTKFSHIWVFAQPHRVFYLNPSARGLEPELDLLTGDELVNSITVDQFMKRTGGDGAAWRGAKEMAPKLFQVLFELLTKKGDIIIDLTASTGISPVHIN